MSNHPVQALDAQLDDAEELVRELEVGDRCATRTASELEAEIERRVRAARAGKVSPDMQELLDDLVSPAEIDDEPWEEIGEDEEVDSDEIEAAWAEEIHRRMEEIRSGAVETYALEDVLAVMRLRYG